MSSRHADGSAGDANYGVIGGGYARYRQPEPRIAGLIHAALGGAGRILNVGAGAGSYEPTDRPVVAVEPSESMRRQRPPGLPPAVDAVAERLPFPDGEFDGSLATFTVHQWSNLPAGLREMRRVTRGPVVILTCDPARVQDFWLNDYAPEVLATEAKRYPAIAAIQSALGGETTVHAVPVPLHCLDGFNEAYYGRPEMFLDAGARLACSAWSFIGPETVGRCVRHLQDDLRQGAWDARYAHFRSLPEFAGSLRLIVGRR